MEIENLTKEIRARAFERKDPKTPRQVAASWYNDDLTYDGVAKTLFIILPTPGCSWAIGDSGGCTMCSYVSDCTLEPIDSKTIVDIFKQHLNRFPVNEEDNITVKLFASGSFLNPRELPKDARDEILNILMDLGNVHEIVVESRAEYVKEEYIDEVVDIIGDTLFEISMGLETSNDYTRLKKINKGFSLDDFNNAVSLIQKLNSKKGYNLKSKAYIFVKPILLNEKSLYPYKELRDCNCINLRNGYLASCPLVFTIQYINDNYNNKYNYATNKINIYKKNITAKDIKE